MLGRTLLAIDLHLSLESSAFSKVTIHRSYSKCFEIHRRIFINQSVTTAARLYGNV